MTLPALTDEAIERGYNNRAAVPDHPYWIGEWQARSRAALDALHPVDVRYGPGTKETLDLYVPTSPARGTLMFIHGGYWRAFDKSDHAFVAPAFVDAGFAVAVMNYDLCPEVTIATIVEQCRRGVAWLAREGPRRGAPAPLVVSGHSAGGQLTAMMHATDWAPLGLGSPPLAGGVTLSGVHDLTPLVRSSYNVDLRLDEDEARRMSPVAASPRTDAPLLVAVGAGETSEFLRQSQLMFDAWPRNRPTHMQAPLAIPDRHHFNVVLDYTDPASALTQATLALLAAHT